MPGILISEVLGSIALIIHTCEKCSNICVHFCSEYPVWRGKGPLIPFKIHFLGLKYSILRILIIIPFEAVMGLLGKFIMEALDKREASA